MLVSDIIPVIREGSMLDDLVKALAEHGIDNPDIQYAIDVTLVPVASFLKGLDEYVKVDPWEYDYDCSEEQRIIVIGNGWSAHLWSEGDHYIDYANRVSFDVKDIYGWTIIKHSDEEMYYVPSMGRLFEDDENGD